jgi:hypothetical protein
MFSANHFMFDPLSLTAGSVSPQFIVSKPAIICHASQLFFVFLALACFCGVASFQAKWGVGPCEFHFSLF